MITTVLVFSLAQSSYQVTEIVFEENFDDTLTGWSESVCDRNDPNQICSLIQDTVIPQAHNPVSAPAPSPPNWGAARIEAFGGGSSILPIEVRYQKTFNVAEADDYDISAWLGITDCSGCVITSQVFVDGALVFARAGVDVGSSPPSPETTFFESTSIPLSEGSHTIEIGMLSTGAVTGDFRASFDDILIQRIIPDTPEQLRAIDKATKALDDACAKIQREIDHLNVKGQTIPIEIVELELRACGL